MNYDSRERRRKEIRHTLEWNQSRLYRSMDWQEDGRACFTCPEEGDYLLYSRAEDRSVRLEGLCVSLPEAGGM